MMRDQNDASTLDRLLARHNDPAPARMKAAIDRVGTRLRTDVNNIPTPPLATSAVLRPGWTFPIVSFAAAAVALLALVGSGTLLRLVRDRDTQATVETVDGTLYRVRFNEIVRTNGEAGAQVALADGSRVEMRSTSALSLERAGDGVRIRLQTGGIIVNAAKQRRGHLYVQTKDVTVSVVGTIFLVNADEEGSRVAVIEGEVRVQQGETDRKLRPGDQVSTSPKPDTLSVKEEIAWSRQAAAHIALLDQSALSTFTRASVDLPTQRGSTSNACGPNEQSRPANPLEQPRWNGWGVDPSQRRFQPAAMAQLTAADVPALKLKWAFGFPDATQAYSQPTIVGGRLFVGSANRKVYSLNAATGCQYWVFDADAPVRAAISIGVNGSAWTAYVADERANVYALDALTGSVRWKRQIDDGPGASFTGAPTLAGSMLYAATSSSEQDSARNPAYECCRFRGSVSAIDAATGVVRWKVFTSPEPKPTRMNAQMWGPSGGPILSSPAVDLAARLVYVNTGVSYSDPRAGSGTVVALDADTGELRWVTRWSATDDFVSSPILVDLPDARRALVTGQQSGDIHAVSAAGGKSLWRTQLGGGGSGVAWGLAADEGHVYTALTDRATGGLFAMDLCTGVVAWRTPHPGCGARPGCSAAQSAAVTAIPGVVFSGGLDGHLRAYAADDGRIIWDVDTVRDYTTVNGVRANGGSLDGPGAVIVGGLLYVNSGYSSTGLPGNALLTFSK